MKSRTKTLGEWQSITNWTPHYKNAFIHSAYWCDFREENINSECEKCSSTDYLVLHHLKEEEYANLKKENFQTLCKTCHQEAHREMRKSTCKKYSFENKKKQILCVETGTIFKSGKEASEWCGQKSRMAVPVCIRENRKCSGYTFEWV